MAEKSNIDLHAVTDSINANSKANFVSRLKEDNLRTIPNWENPDEVSSHKMSYGERDGKFIVYPNIQEIDGQLHDFTDPKYNHGKWDAMESAYKNGDYVEMPDEKTAAAYASGGYKDYYPSFSRLRTAMWLNRLMKH